MYFGLSEDQIFFQDNVKKFLEDNADLDIIRKISDDDKSSLKEDIHKGIVNLGINNILIPLFFWLLFAILLVLTGLFILFK